MKFKLPTEVWMAMDGRANDNIDDAACLEAYTTRPSMKELKQAWGQQGAVLVRCFNPDADGVLQSSEVVAQIP